MTSETAVENEWAVVHALAARWPFSVDAGENVVSACRLLGLPPASEVLAASYVLGVAVGVVGGAFGLLLTGAGSYSFLLPLALAAGATVPLIAQYGTVGAARFRRARTLGEGPALFGRLILRLRLEPSLERASRFAAQSGEGRLSAALGAQVRRSRGGPEAGLRSFTENWAEWEPALKRAGALVVDAADAPPAERARGCERALETVTTSIERRLRSFADDLRGPVTGLYAFGVLLPLALVGVLPAARLAGLQVSIGQLTVLYNVVLPLGLVVAGAWLLTQRPVAFPPPRVGPDHPEVPEKGVESAVFGVVCGAAAATVCLPILPWAAPVAAVGAGVGVTLYWHFQPRTAVRERVRETEAGLPDALALVGRRVADGVAVERALVTAGEELPGATGALLRDAAERGRVLGLPVRSAFFGPNGVLSELPSARSRDAATMFALAATEGGPAGELLVAAGDHLRTLQRAEADGRRELAAVTGTLANTAVLFGPLVGGVTVAMVGGVSVAPAAASSVSAGAGAGATGFGTAALGQVVGVYVLALAAVLTALATALEHGVDWSLLGVRVGIALPTATGAYVAAVVAAGSVL